MDFGEYVLTKYADDWYEVLETITGKIWTFTYEKDAKRFYESRKNGNRIPY